jgi:hypothetical protein
MNQLKRLRQKSKVGEWLIYGIRCGWNHSVNRLDLMTTEFVDINLRKRPLRIISLIRIARLLYPPPAITVNIEQELVLVQLG